MDSGPKGVQMALMVWDAKLQVGHAKIDEDHKTLVEAINQLHAAMKLGKGRAEVGNILTFLKDYTVKHFHMEEELMTQGHYPGAAQHKQIHQDLVKQVVELTDGYAKGTVNLTLPVMDFLEAWLSQHILTEDLKLVEFLRK